MCLLIQVEDAWNINSNKIITNAPGCHNFNKQPFLSKYAVCLKLERSVQETLIISLAFGGLILQYGFHFLFVMGHSFIRNANCLVVTK